MADLDKAFAGKIPTDRMKKYNGRILRLMATTTSRYLAAMDRKTGKVAWVYKGADNAYICHASIAIGDGGVFLVEGRETQKDKTTKHLVRLDAKTGKKLWETKDLTTYCNPGPILHRPPARVLVNSTEVLSLAYKNNVLVLGEVWGGRSLFALSAKDGKFLWKNKVHYNYYYRRRSVIIGNAVYTDRYAYDLKTGRTITRDNPISQKPEPWVYSRSYGCGGTSASANDLFFRSSVISYFDLENDQGITNFGGVRPGCWINIIPASGLVLIPDMTRGCTCPYPIKTSIVFRPTDTHRAWSYIQLRSALKPVINLAVNLGAPGDRRTKDGLLWLGYPRPFHARGFRFTLPAVINKNLGFFNTSPDRLKVDSKFTPWLFNSGVCALEKLTIPLARKGRKNKYALQLFFAEIYNAAPGQRVFDVLVQGKPVLKNFDIAREAKGVNKGIVREFDKIFAEDNMVIELVSKSKNQTRLNAPLLNAVRVIRLSGLKSFKKLDPLPPLKKPLLAPVSPAKTSVKIDGVLDEPFWKEAQKHSLRDNLTQDRPYEETVFRLARTQNEILLGIECANDDMENIPMKATGGDKKAIWKDEAIEVFIAVSKSNCFQFAFNAAGAWCDINWNDGSYRKAVKWNSGLKVKATRSKKGWTVEAAIPILAIEKHLGFKPTLEKPWKFDVFRTARPQDGGSQYSAWSPTMTQRFRDPSEFGHLFFK